jgi:hypothetical protein
MEWQLIDKDEWVLGEKVRGIVRVVRATVYFDEETDGPRGGWHWSARNSGGVIARGVAMSLIDAVVAAELSLGILSSE